MDRYKITAQTFDKHAQLYADRFMDATLYNTSFDVFCNVVTKENPNVFEIGCGPGNVSKYLLHRRPDFNIFGIDVAPNMIALAKATNPQANYNVMDCRDINQLDQKFDAIVCAFCMPYIAQQDCENLIRNCAEMLPSGGIFYFSTITGDYADSGFESGSTSDLAYVYYHSEAYLFQVVAANNFEVIFSKQQDYVKSDGKTVVDMMIIATKI